MLSEKFHLVCDETYHYLSSLRNKVTEGEWSRARARNWQLREGPKDESCSAADGSVIFLCLPSCFKLYLPPLWIEIVTLKILYILELLGKWMRFKHKAWKVINVRQLTSKFSWSTKVRTITNKSIWLIIFKELIATLSLASFTALLSRQEMSCDDHDPYFADEETENSERLMVSQVQNVKIKCTLSLQFSNFQWQDCLINFHLLL